MPVSQPDQYLYRFVSLAGERADQLRDVILTHRLFQPSPITFNDPFDCRAIASFDVPDSEWRAYFEALIKRGNLGGTDPSHEIDRMMLEKERQGAEFSAGMLRRIQADIDAAGVLCFSSDPNEHPFVGTLRERPSRCMPTVRRTQRHLRIRSGGLLFWLV